MEGVESEIVPPFLKIVRIVQTPPLFFSYRQSLFLEGPGLQTGDHSESVNFRTKRTVGSDKEVGIHEAHESWAFVFLNRVLPHVQMQQEFQRSESHSQSVFKGF